MDIMAVKLTECDTVHVILTETKCDIKYSIDFNNVRDLNSNELEHFIQVMKRNTKLTTEEILQLYYNLITFK